MHVVAARVAFPRQRGKFRRRRGEMEGVWGVSAGGGSGRGGGVAACRWRAAGWREMRPTVYCSSGGSRRGRKSLRCVRREKRPSVATTLCRSENTDARVVNDSISLFTQSYVVMSPFDYVALREKRRLVQKLVARRNVVDRELDRLLAQTCLPVVQQHVVATREVVAAQVDEVQRDQRNRRLRGVVLPLAPMFISYAQ